MKKIMTVCAAALAAAGAAAVPPVVDQVALAQPQGARAAVVTYRTDTPGIATFQFRTNGADVCHAEIVRTVTGGINKYLPAGTHTFTWDAGRDFPERVVSNLTVEVTLWATDNPPDYCAVALVGATNAPVRWYAKASDVPFGVTDSRWKKDWLLLRKIPATQGETVTLGSPPGETGRQNSDAREDLRFVRITEPFYMGVYQVTQRQWQNIAATGTATPSFFSHQAYWEERPVEGVSHNDIRGAAPTVNWPATGHAVDTDSFMGKLRARTGGFLAFDLPTDAQWEYACRAGTSGAWNNGATITSTSTGSAADVNLPLLARCTLNGGTLPDGVTQANCTDANGTAKVGSYLPNAWDLYDMHGNVFEWCLDFYSDDAALLAGDDPAGPGLASGNRLSRGGRWGNAVADCRAAFRYSISPTTRNANTGFRIVAPATAAFGQ